MSYFNYQNNTLHCEDVSLQEISQKAGTPVYIYSYQTLKDQYTSFEKAFSDVDHLICYSMKANSNRAILKSFINLGSGIDVVSGGELYLALKAGCPPQKIVFSGVGKSSDEIEAALKAGILQFNVESIDEIEAIEQDSKRLNKKAPIALRVNPNVDSKTHAYISTGLKKAKFGICHDEVLATYKQIQSKPHLEIVGIDCHIGSQLTTVAPFVEAAQKVKELILQIRKHGIKIKNLDLGGGLGITYDQETPPSVKEYAEAIKKETKDLDCKLIFEPGRYMVGHAGALLTKVLYNKERESKHFTIVDAASNDLMRPALYDAYHNIQPLILDKHRSKIKTDIVGPICETGDFLALDREIPLAHNGEFLAIMSAGAYGFSMSSTYNSRPRCTEIMVKGDQYWIIREREKVEDLDRGEKVPGFLG